MTVKTPDPANPEGQDDKPQSARDSIRAAMAEHREKEAKVEETKVEVKPETKVEETKVEVKPETKVETKVVDPKEVKVETKVEETKVEAKDPKEGEEGKGQEESKAKVKVPFGLPKSIREQYEKADPELRDFLSKTLKENLDTKANEGRRAPMRDVEQVLTPIMQDIQQAGVTPAQFVKRLVDYTYALAHPNAKYQAIAQLAHDYQIDLTLFGPKGLEKKEDPKAGQGIENIPPELNQKLDTILNRFSQLETTQKTSNEQAAADQLNNWAGLDATTNEYKAKPYFPYVRQMMHSLIASGAVPLKDGKIDLDGAYDAACFAHPEIREYMVEEQTRSAQTEQLRQQQTQQQQLAKIKNAGSSLKPGAPVVRSPNSVVKPNSKGQPTSVRDSLRQALAQMRDGQ